MDRTRTALSLAAALLACASGSPFEGAPGRAIDLTHAFDDHTLFWPTEEGFVLERSFAGSGDAGTWYAAHRYRAAEHGGTHMDAPVHFSEAGRGVDEVPLHQLMAEGVLVDVAEPCERDRDYRVRTADLVAWEARHGSIPRGSIVLLRTGFGRHWPDRRRYLGTEARGPGAVAELHFPGLHPETARWLVEQRAVRAVGLDTASIDHGPSTGFEAHRVLATHQVPVFENLANLERLPARGFQLIALPMKIRGGSGAPLRIVALPR